VAASDGSGDRLRLTFSVPAHVLAARLFAASIARHFGLQEGVVEDVKLAISEACTEALRRRARDGDELSVSAVSRGGGIEFEVAHEGDVRPDDPGKPAVPGAELHHMPLVRALFPGAELVADARGTVIRFSAADRQR